MPKTILSLPPELLSLTLSFLDTPDGSSLAKCARVSKTFNSIAIPILYRRVCIPTRVNLGIITPSSSDSADRMARRKRFLQHTKYITIEPSNLGISDAMKMMFSSLKLRIDTLEIKLETMVKSALYDRFLLKMIDVFASIFICFNPRKLLISDVHITVKNTFRMLDSMMWCMDLEELSFVKTSQAITLPYPETIYTLKIPPKGSQCVVLKALKKITLPFRNPPVSGHGSFSSYWSARKLPDVDSLYEYAQFIHGLPQDVVFHLVNRDDSRRNRRASSDLNPKSTDKESEEHLRVCLTEERRKTHSLKGLDEYVEGRMRNIHFFTMEEYENMNLY